MDLIKSKIQIYHYPIYRVPRKGHLTKKNTKKTWHGCWGYLPENAEKILKMWYKRENTTCN